MTQPPLGEDAAATTSPSPPPERHRPRDVIVALATFGVVIVAMLGWYFWANSAYQRSFSPTATLEQRASAADFAARLVPFDQRFWTRAEVMDGWLRGKRLLDSGDYNGAINALGAVYVLDIGDEELLALYTKAQDVQRIQTNWKAHAQHGHEQPGGVLRPEDIIK